MGSEFIGNSEAYVGPVIWETFYQIVGQRGSDICHGLLVIFVILRVKALAKNLVSCMARSRWWICMGFDTFPEMCYSSFLSCGQPD